METNRYVSVNTAKLLKKAEYDEWCDSFYGWDHRHNGESIDEDEEYELKARGEGKEIKHIQYGKAYYFNYKNSLHGYGKCLARPILFDVLNWLRNNLGIHITIHYSIRTQTYFSTFVDVNNNQLIDDIDTKGLRSTRYEEVVDNSIQHYLKYYLAKSTKRN